MTKHKPKDELKDIVYITHYFSDFDSETKHMTRNQRAIYLDLRTLYFTTAHKNNGSLTDDLPLLYFRLDCHSDSDKADLAWLLKDKFKKLGKTYRHNDWDKQIKNIRFAMRNGGNTDTKSNAKSNGSNGGGVTPSNIDGNAKIYDNSNGLVMTGAERTEKSRKLKSLKNKGVQADKSMTLDEIRGLYDAHFNKNNSACNATPAPPSNDDSNADGNGSNAQIGEKSHNPFPITQELQEKNECVKSETLHAPTHTNFSQKLKTIGEWQAPSVDIINGLLSGTGFGRTLSQDEYGQIFTKFKNYNVSRELQGNFLATEQVRIDKLIDWIKREKPVYATPPTPPQSELNILKATDNTDELINNEFATPAVIDTKTMFLVAGFYKPCFDGYTPSECRDILTKYRLPSETTFECYQRIYKTGVDNCKPFVPASSEFVKSLLAELKSKSTNQQARA